MNAFVCVSDGLARTWDDHTTHEAQMAGKAELITDPSQRLPRTRDDGSNVQMHKRALGFRAGPAEQWRWSRALHTLIEAPSHRRAARNPLPETLSQHKSKRSHPWLRPGDDSTMGS